MTGVVVAVYAGIVVSDVVASARWYAEVLPCDAEEEGNGWSCLRFPDNSTLELFAGDPARAGETFPSYGGDAGPPIMPGYAVDDPEEAVEGLRISRSLPDWQVVVAPDGLRIVVTLRDTDKAPGLAGFRYESPQPVGQRLFLARLGIADPVASGPVSVVPQILGERPQRLIDPDGNPIEVVTSLS